MQNTSAGGGYEANIHVEPGRTSLAAIFSLVCSVICCIPVLPVVGVVLGIAGVRRIERSEGRLGGKGLAIAGIVLGIAVTLVQGVFGYALGYGSKWIVAHGDIAAQVLTDLENADYDAARSVFAGDVAAISDDDLGAFGEAVRADVGTVVAQPRTGWGWFNGWNASGQYLQRYQGRNDFIPIPVTFSNEPGLIILIHDPGQQRHKPAPGQQVAIVDLIVIGTDGTEHVLSDYQPRVRPGTDEGGAP